MTARKKLKDDLLASSLPAVEGELEAVMEERNEDHLEGSLRPRTLADYIGQEGVKQNLRIAIDAAKQRGDERAQAEALVSMGIIQVHRNQRDGALKLFERSLRLYTQYEDQRCIALVHSYLGSISYLGGQWANARRHYQTTLRIMTSIGDI